MIPLREYSAPQHRHLNANPTEPGPSPGHDVGLIPALRAEVRAKEGPMSR